MRIANMLLLPVLMFALSVPAAGCRPLARESFKTPKVRVADVSLASNPFNDPKGPWKFTLTLDVDNQNAYALDIAKVAYSVAIGRETVAEGDHLQDMHIEASSVTTVKVPLALRPDPFLSAVRKVLQVRQFDYEFNGSVGLRTPLTGIVHIPFSKAGSVDSVDFLKKKPIGFN